LNASERVEHDQVGVAGDNLFRMTRYGKFQKLVVLWIAAGNDLHIDVDPLGLARKSGKKTSNFFLIYVTAELFSAQNVIKFSKDSKREQNFSSPLRKIKSPPRLRIVQEQCAHKYAGI
jgi:hypothetical protein